MKHVIKLLSIVFLIIDLMLIISCKEEESVEPVLTAPVLTTVSISGITQTSAVSGGTITDDGGAAVTARGVCWGTSSGPTTSGSKTTDGSGTGTFASAITGLTVNTQYFVRSYATNSKGTSYGNEVSFTTSPVVLATLSTTTVTAITRSSATSGGAITEDGGGAISARGVCWSKAQNPTVTDSKTTDGTGKGNFVSNITGLDPATKYYVRAYATNAAGTAYGNEVSFTTDPIVLATLTTTLVSSPTSSSAVSGGTVSNDGGGTITARGVCWSKNNNPTIADSKTTDGTGIGSFVSNIKGLDPVTNYFIRAYATNSAGTAYGNEVPLTTLQLKDADGNLYTSVEIGTQVWMVENLKTTKYNDNTTIPLITTEFSSTAPAYSWYDNNEVTYKSTYGALYNWYAVDTKKLCPAGWHVPSDVEWTTLVTFLGGENVAGRKLKEEGITHWVGPNDATNESGFTALPGGYRLPGNYGNNMGYSGRYWSSTIHVPVPPEIDDWAYGRDLNYAVPNIWRLQTIKDSGSSVRCLRD